jgi:hypothetical protein
MTLANADGSLVSKEVYKYEADSLGNWVKMTTSVAVVENGKIAFEPTEVTYRTIFYYLDAAMMAKMAEPASSEVKPTANSGASANHAEGEKVAVTLPLPTTSLDKLKLSAAQPGSPDLRGAALDTNKKVVLVKQRRRPPRPLLSRYPAVCSMAWPPSTVPA